MKKISQELKEHKQGEVTTTCHIWKVVRKDGKTYGYTDYDSDLFYNGIQYQSVSGYSLSAIKTNANLAVNNLEIKGPLGNIPIAITDVDPIQGSLLTDADIQAGLWDYARVDLYEVNYEDLSMGALWKNGGTLGEIKTTRNNVSIELRGLTQALSQEAGRVFTSSCQSDLGDRNCRLDLSKYTFDGKIDRINDIHSWFDYSLNQTNSSYQKGIDNIEKGQITRITVNGHGLSSGDIITLSEIGGTFELNGRTNIITYIDTNTFSIAVDSQKMDDYKGGGKITKSIISEYFKDGYIIWTSGNNKGLKFDIKTYKPNYVQLHDALIFKPEIGDTYKIVAGCDKLISTCNSRFNNRINFYGFNLIPGQDRLISGT